MKNIYLLTFLMFFFSCSKEDNIIKDAEPEKDPHLGCTDYRAINHSPEYTYDDNSCDYTPTSCADCDFIIEPAMSVIDNNDLKLPPGSTIGIRGGERKSLIIRNFYGTKEKPYIFINCDAQVIAADELPTIKLHTLNHVRLTGTGSSDTYGIKITGGRPFGIVAELAASNVEVDHVEISGVKGPAISARTRPVCDGSTNRGTFTQENTILHHNYIHDVGGEGFYIGGSHWHTQFPQNPDCPDLTLLEPELEGVLIYNNRVENVGQDGIQVGGAIKGCKIYNNTVINYGLKNIEIHQSGIQINPGTTGTIFSNLIKGGTGSAIFLNGFDNKVYSNIIINCARDGIHIGDRNPPEGKSYVLVNNTMYGIGELALYMNSKLSVNNVFYNNLLIGITDGLHNKLSNEVSLDIDNNMLLTTIEEAGVTKPEQGDFTPKAGSPLIDAGKNIDAYTIDVDFLLNPREKGAQVDIGAVEYPNN